MSRKNRKATRVQMSKGRAGGTVVKSGSNPEYVTAMQGLRSSNATVPVPSGKAYRRKAKHNRLTGEVY